MGRAPTRAVAAGHVLLADNEREFARVPGLPCGNWLRGEPVLAPRLHEP